MKLSSFFVLGAALGRAHAHYLFGRLIFDNKWTGTWEYVRQIGLATTEPTFDPNLALLTPNIDPTSLDLRCGHNASIAWFRPSTANVRAGDTVGFAAGEPRLQQGDLPRIYHPGFASVWLSRAPTGDLNSYTGDGDWFKILSITNRTAQSLDFSKPENKNLYDVAFAFWGTFNVNSWNFTIPKTTPPGKYLLRFEHIFPSEYDSQFYVNCAHVNIINNGRVGTPGPLVKIPGVYTHGQPDAYFNAAKPPLTGTEFIPPKPAVWTG